MKNLASLTKTCKYIAVGAVLSAATGCGRAYFDSDKYVYKNECSTEIAIKGFSHRICDNFPFGPIETIVLLDTVFVLPSGESIEFYSQSNTHPAYGTICGSDSIVVSNGTHYLVHMRRYTDEDDPLYRKECYTFISTVTRKADMGPHCGMGGTPYETLRTYLYVFRDEDFASAVPLPAPPAQ
ncbi:MAG: hypothetical protein LBH06_01830 [Rikenellaceae bacterium]|jgi:hypothetical protein|nr:hypothetical protein [Rikenellaceae bacterium]